MLLSKDDIADQNFRITDNNAINMHVSERLRLHHAILGMSPEQLGANRISASRLWDISQILDAPTSYFF